MTTRMCGLLLAGCLLGLALPGCGSGLRLGKVSGRVTFAGKPVTTGVIMFHPAAGPTAVGEIGPDGSYTLTTLKKGDGAVVGSHRVTIESMSVGPGSMAEPKSIDEELAMRHKGKILVPGKVDRIVPEKYSKVDTSGLTATVEPGSNTIPFDIPKR